MRTLLTLALMLAAVPPRAGAAAGPGADAARTYAIDTGGSTERLAVGERGKLVLSILPLAAGWKVHPEAPLRIRFQAPGALGLAKAELGRADAADPKGATMRFENAIAPTARGRQQATARVDFFICSDVACVKQSRSVAFAIDVS